MKARYLALIPAAVAGAALVRTALMPKKTATYVPTPAEERSMAYAQKLSAMVRCDTTSHANVREDEQFARFHQVLEEQFPWSTGIWSARSSTATCCTAGKAGRTQRPLCS